MSAFFVENSKKKMKSIGTVIDRRGRGKGGSQHEYSIYKKTLSLHHVLKQPLLRLHSI